MQGRNHLPNKHLKQLWGFLCQPKSLLILILFSTFLLRGFRIWYPEGYVFDEVYHAFTAKEMLAGHKEAWEWWNTPPQGVAYEWTHPPLAKEIMALSMALWQTTQSWAYRLPGILSGVLAVFIVYLIAKLLFKQEKIALLAAFFFSIDGLNFVQSRVGMNDIYFVTFMLISFYFFLKERFFFSSLFLGFSLASKWSAVYLIGLYFLIIILQKRYLKFIYFLIIPLLIYLLSYLPFFLIDHQYPFELSSNNLKLFVELQKQMWWYHTGLKATHDYASPWWSWPLNLYPVWYDVQYLPNGLIANIFGSGNPLIFWLGFIALVLTTKEIAPKFWQKPVLGFSLSYLFFVIAKILLPNSLLIKLPNDLLSYLFQRISLINLSSLADPPSLFFFLFSLNSLGVALYALIKRQHLSQAILILAYFIFLLPWSISPRIMFLYHYSPSLPFLTILLAYQFTLLRSSNLQKMVFPLIMATVFIFIFLYPVLTDLPLPRDLLLLFFHTNITKNPFQ